MSKRFEINIKTIWWHDVHLLYGIKKKFHSISSFKTFGSGLGLDLEFGLKIVF